MRATLIQIGKSYEVKAGCNRTTVKVESFNRKTGGWVCETKGGKNINIKDAARFVREIASKKSETPAKGKKAVAKTERTKSIKSNGVLSGIEAAHRVLAEAKRPMRVKEIVEIALANGYCKLRGLTPEFTISAAMQREIKVRNENSRFVKTERGFFAAR